MRLLAPALALAPSTDTGGGGGDWWDVVNNSPAWQDGFFFSLSALYGLIAIPALIQLIRIEHRIPECGWTSQKIFVFLNFLVSGVRCVVFALRKPVQQISTEIIQHILLDLPGLAFMTTYALLALFWAEIYYQARATSSEGLRPAFYSINCTIYAIQIALWLIIWWKPSQITWALSEAFFAGILFCASLGFLLYGGRLFMMLKNFPLESKARVEKLYQVGRVTIICFTCFLVRSIVIFFGIFNEGADLDVLNHPILNFLYYLLLEIIPAALVLIILRKLPSKFRNREYYQPIN